MAGKMRRELMSVDCDNGWSVLEIDGLGMRTDAAIVLADNDKNSRLLSIS